MRGYVNGVDDGVGVVTGAATKAHPPAAAGRGLDVHDGSVGMFGVQRGLQHPDERRGAAEGAHLGVELEQAVALRFYFPRHCLRTRAGIRGSASAGVGV
jgi:hypothetical protein